MMRGSPKAVEALRRRGRPDPIGDHTTGTDRVAEVVARMPEARLIVNLQGDEPEISGEALDLVVAVLEADPEAPMAILATPIRDAAVYPRSLVRQGRPIDPGPGPLFLPEPDPPPSRLPARLPRRPPRRPCSTSASTPTAATSSSISPSDPPLPARVESEKLEQLRVLEAGHPIALGIVQERSVGIDTPEDYRRFVERFRAANPGA